MAEKPIDLPVEAESAPDPEEDDLSDLDDVLDEFTPKPNLPASPKPTISGPGRPAQPPLAQPTLPTASEIALAAAAADEEPGTSSNGAEEGEDLAAQLQAGMGNLMSELGDNPDMQRQFEAMMQELIAAGSGGVEAQGPQATAPISKDASANTAAAGIGGTKGGKAGKDFQSTIQKTMERMQQSGEAATAATASKGSGGGNKSEEELLMEMLASMGGAGGEGGEEDFNKMLLNMMTQLVNKEILYEPMKELDGKFPAWMEKNEGKVGKADWDRYVEQQRLVREIVARFERPGYQDENEDDREYIVERMQKMQEAGSPPPDLVGDMSEAQAAIGEMDAGCPTQ